jgi:hypothetical protein
LLESKKRPRSVQCVVDDPGRQVGSELDAGIRP